ncbi:hypothetical protein IAE22_30665, partial [Bacillus sp. S34]|nr:hypothetical protein [Bacillus sp. S34]
MKLGLYNAIFHDRPLAAALEGVDLPPVLRVLRVEPFLGVATGGVELSAQCLCRGTGRRGVRAGAGAGERPGDHGADGGADHETDDQGEDLHVVTLAGPTDTAPPGRSATTGALA